MTDVIQETCGNTDDLFINQLVLVPTQLNGISTGATDLCPSPFPWRDALRICRHPAIPNRAQGFDNDLEMPQSSRRRQSVSGGQTPACDTRMQVAMRYSVRLQSGHQSLRIHLI